MPLKREGIGSFFHEINIQELKDAEDLSFFAQHKLFYTGRHALRYILDHVQKQKKVRYIWIPGYYCHHVTHWLCDVYPNIKRYSISPFKEDSEHQLPEVTPDDIVIVNNFFGISDLKYSRHYTETIYIEDHSHSWLTRQCRESTADYCFASLRKSLPVPLGGIFWIPSKSGEHFIDAQGVIDKSIYMQWDKALRAMKMKRKYVEGIVDDKKYLEVYKEAEDFLDGQYSYVEMQPQHLAMLQKFAEKDYLFYKSRNLEAVIPLVKTSPLFQILHFKTKTPFGLSLIFKEREVFSALRSHLIDNGIYPSELWPDNILEEDYKFLLNIHVDFRYNMEDMRYISSIINKWSASF